MANYQKSGTGAAGGAGEGFNFFSTPSLLSTAQFASKALTSYFGHKVGKYEAKRATYEKERQYWQQKNDIERKNYREYNYQLKSWYRDSEYTEKRKQYETKMQEQTAKYKGEVALAATQNLGRQIADLDTQFFEETAKEAMEIEMNKLNTDSQAAKAGLKGRGRGVAVGRSVDASRQQFYQQEQMMLGSKQITRNFRVADRAKAIEASAIQAQNAAADIQDYTPQPVSNPIKPLAPLAVRGVTPSKVHGPSGIKLTMDVVGHAVDAVDTYRSWQPPSGDSGTSSEDAKKNLGN